MWEACVGVCQIWLGDTPSLDPASNSSLWFSPCEWDSKTRRWNGVPISYVLLIGTWRNQAKGRESWYWLLLTWTLTFNSHHPVLTHAHTHAWIHGLSWTPWQKLTYTHLEQGQKVLFMQQTYTTITTQLDRLYILMCTYDTHAQCKHRHPLSVSR